MTWVTKQTTITTSDGEYSKGTIEGGPFFPGAKYDISWDWGPRESFFINGRWTSSFHGGMDIAAPLGTALYSLADATVVWVGFDVDGAGNWVGLLTGEGPTSVRHDYYHMMLASPLVEGAQVKAGDFIGMVGSTGASTGPHVHLQISQGDPRPSLEEAPDVGTLPPVDVPAHEVGLVYSRFESGTNTDVYELRVAR